MSAFFIRLDLLPDLRYQAVKAIIVPGGKHSVVERSAIITQDCGLAEELAKQWAKVESLDYVSLEVLYATPAYNKGEHHEEHQSRFQEEHGDK